MQIEMTEARAKQMARTLQTTVARSLSYQQALEAVARQFGYEEFGALKDAIRKAATAKKTPPREVTLTRANLADWHFNALMDLAEEIDRGAARLTLADFSRQEVEEIWLECDLLQGRLEDPYDVEKNGFVGMHERNEATLLADVALNDQLHRLTASPAPADRAHKLSVSTSLQHPMEEIFWTVELRPAPQGIDSFITAARSALGKQPTLGVVTWAIGDDGRPSGGWEALDHALVPQDDETVDPEAARALNAPAVEGSIHAFTHETGLEGGHLWAGWGVVLWSHDAPARVLERGGFVVALIPGADSPMALRGARDRVDDLLTHTFLN